MTRYIKDDVRYMTHEVRIAEGYMAAPEWKTAAPAVTTCYCGKTVTHTHGRRVMAEGKPVECPRRCEEHRGGRKEER